jgi:hypothetical protein
MARGTWRSSLWVMIGMTSGWVACTPAARAAADPVFFAGAAFTGDAANTEQAFPHLSRMLGKGGAARFDALLRQAAQAHPAKIELVFDQLGSTKDARRSTALALAIDRETTSVEHVGDLYKVRLEVAAQLLFFDFKEKQVLGGFPLILDYVDAMPRQPTDADIDAGFQKLVLDGTSAHGLPMTFVDALGQATVPSASTRHLRVTSVTLQDKARTFLQQYAPSVDTGILTAQVAQEFSKYLAHNQHLAILPYRSNGALGSSMAARFVEGDAYDLKIPEADYEVALDVAGFKKLEQGRNAVNAIYIYGAFVDISVREPLSNRVYFAQRVKQGASKDVPVTQTTVDDWAASYEAMLLLFDNFTRAISDPKGAWTKSALPEGSESRSQLSSLAELMNACR